MAVTQQVITQLIVDASGAKTGVADFEAALAKAKAAANDTGSAMAGGPNSFDSAVKKWTQSLAATDPVIRAQIQQQQALQRQVEINNQAVTLGIATQEAAAAQLEKVRDKYQAYISQAEEASMSSGKFSGAIDTVTEGLGYFGIALGVEKLIEWGKSTIEAAQNANDLGEALNTSAGFVLAFETAAGKVGIPVDSADKALEKLNQTVSEALLGNDQAIKAFADLGISTKNLVDGDGKLVNLSEITGLVAEGFQKTQGASHDASDAVELFGRSGQRLIPVLQDGATAAIALGHGQDEIGAASQRNIVAASSFGAAIDDMGASIKNSSIDIVGWTARLFGIGSPLDILPPKIHQLQNEIAALETKKGEDDWLSWLASSASADAIQKRIDQDVVQLVKLQDALKAAKAATGTGQNPPVFNVTGLTNAESTMQDQAQRTGLSKSDQLYEQNVLTLTKALGVQANSFADAQQKLGPYKDQIDQVARSTADLTQKNLDAAEAQKKLVGKSGDFNQYLSGLAQAAANAGLTTAQLEDQQAIIKGYDEYQKSVGVTQDHLSKDYADSLTNLQKISEARGHDYVTQILQEESQKRLNTLNVELNQQFTLAAVAAGNDRDTRELALQIAQKQLQAGVQLTDQQKQQLAASQALTDASRMRDYIDQLKDEAVLAGTTSDEREKQEAILQAMRLTHGQLTQSQAEEISSLIQIRQETEQWQNVVQGITTPCEEFPDDIVNSPKVRAEIKKQLKEIFQK